MPNYETVIFDMDGTLLDTLDDLTDSVNAAMHEYGFPLRDREDVRRFIGNGVRRLVERSAPENTPPQDIERCLEILRVYYQDHMQDKTKPFDGIVPMLARLREEGVRLAIVSNKYDAAVAALAEKFFGDLILVAIGESEAVRRKPEPDSVFEALRRLGADPSRAVYVGDSEVDVQTAANADIAVIAVTWGFRPRKTLREAGAANIADSVGELAALLGV
jgi:phosphoglycolate phosphatase